MVTPPREADVSRPLHRGDVTIAMERPVSLEGGRPFALRHLGRAADSGVVTLLLD